MPLRTLKYKVGDQLFDSKQSAVQHAAANGGSPERIIVETDHLVGVTSQDDGKPDVQVVVEADALETTVEEVPKKRGPGRPRKT